MALSYDEGMATLRSIFPSWDPQVLSELLEANQGNLESTIEMALSMEPPAPSVRTPPPPAPSRQLPYNPPRVSPRARDPSGRRSRVTLPDDFLRLPSDLSDAVGAHALSEQEQRDEMLARMLQDEIFRQELMADEELSAHFQDRRRPSQAAAAYHSSGLQREKSATELATETFNTMSEKFTSMSEVMKKKMHEMYLKFQTRSDAPAKHDPKSGGNSPRHSMSNVTRRSTSNATKKYD
ncbi:hypothetical protein P43SY_001979 [Pythium insidiosum]|uniref:CUE domain-containing protein n=1 Tax=Pythium insidiosum TaxID=114742 RepID=A0AAD5QCI0_PYTIN|nr:hypothetical protein P43SY_001979 [Pythium insidiosum]